MIDYSDKQTWVDSAIRRWNKWNQCHPEIKNLIPGEKFVKNFEKTHELLSKKDYALSDTLLGGNGSLGEHSWFGTPSLVQELILEQKDKETEVFFNPTNINYNDFITRFANQMSKICDTDDPGKLSDRFLSFIGYATMTIGALFLSIISGGALCSTTTIGTIITTALPATKFIATYFSPLFVITPIFALSCLTVVAAIKIIIRDVVKEYKPYQMGGASHRAILLGYTLLPPTLNPQANSPANDLSATQTRQVDTPPFTSDETGKSASDEVEKPAIGAR
jgi:hypothetical protein